MPANSICSCGTPARHTPPGDSSVPQLSRLSPTHEEPSSTFGAMHDRHDGAEPTHVAQGAAQAAHRKSGLGQVGQMSARERHVLHKHPESARAGDVTTRHMEWQESARILASMLPYVGTVCERRTWCHYGDAPGPSQHSRRQLVVGAL